VRCAGGPRATVADRWRYITCVAVQGASMTSEIICASAKDAMEYYIPVVYILHFQMWTGVYFSRRNKKATLTTTIHPSWHR
jgi:hypothetical protein